jgi:hypothetical protein
MNEQTKKVVQQALDVIETPIHEQPFMAKQKAITALRQLLEQPAPVQEPIGYLWPTGMHPEFRFTQQERDGVEGTPVYFTPPAQPAAWVGLTDTKGVLDFGSETVNNEFIRGALWADAKLREKNGGKV